MNQNRSLLALPRLSVLFTAGVLVSSASAMQAAPVAQQAPPPPAAPAVEVVELAPAAEPPTAQEAQPKRLRVLRLDGNDEGAADEVLLRRPIALGRRAMAVQDSGFLGVQLRGDGDSEGAAIAGTIDGTAAAKAGIQAGDVIVEINDQEVADMDALREILRGMKAGEEVELELLRDGEEVELELKLGSRPGGAGVPAPAPRVEEEPSEVLVAPSEGGQRVRLLKPGASYRVLRVDGDGEGGANAAEAPSSGFFFDDVGKGEEHEVRVEVKAEGEGDGDVRVWVNGEEVDPGEAQAHGGHGLEILGAEGLEGLEALGKLGVELEGLQELGNVHVELKGLESLKELHGLEGLSALENLEIELEGLEGLHALHGMQKVDVQKLPGAGVQRQVIVRKRGDGDDEHDVQVWVNGEEVEGGELPHGVHVFGGGDHTFEWIGDGEVQGLIRARIHGDDDHDGEDDDEHFAVQIHGQEHELPARIERHILRGMGEDGGAWVGRLEPGQGPGRFAVRGGPGIRTFVQGPGAGPGAAQLRQRVEAMEKRLDRMERAIDELRAAMGDHGAPASRRGGARRMPPAEATPGEAKDAPDSELRRELRDVMRAIERLERRERRGGSR